MTHSFDKGYWDQIWTGQRGTAMSTSDPNPHLLHEIGGLTPGTAIDVGCGAGAEAIWLAARGWDVTGADVAHAALTVAKARATAAGLTGQIAWVQADLSTWVPPRRFDLVATHYAHPQMPQLDFYERIASWVAPRGTLLIVGHLENGSTHGSRQHGHGDSLPPAEASTTADAITERLDRALWSVVTAAESTRTMAGPDGQSITIRDAVVRATRR